MCIRDSYVICHFCLKMFLITSVSACDILLYSHGRKKCIVLKKIADQMCIRDRERDAGIQDLCMEYQQTGL